MSINADTRQLAVMEHMCRAKKEKSVLPFFFIEKLLYSAYGAFYNRFEEKMRYFRGDNTLLMHVLKTLDKWLYNNYYRKSNRYGFKSINIECESGMLDGKCVVLTYYLMNAKILADRYNTATHEQFFYGRSRESGVGIIDYQSYHGSTMTDEEFDSQNSYSRLSMTNPDWQDPFIEAQQKIKALAKAKIDAEAKILREDTYNDLRGDIPDKPKRKSKKE